MTEQAPSLADKLRELERRLALLELRPVDIEVQRADFRAQEGQHCIIESPPLGIVVTLPHARAQNRNHRITFTLRNTNPVRFISVDSLINGRSSGVMNVPGTFDAVSDGLQGWGISSLAGGPGARGSTGALGPMGPGGGPGNDGADGRDGDVGPPGAVGAPGAQGGPGAPGTDGVDGRDGDPGAPGAMGPTGPVGPIGAPGQDGQDGRDGNDGAPGTTGATGPTGPLGAPGNDGQDGADGRDGAPGVVGPTGATGATGATGPIGPPGIDGNDGADGVDGQPGAPGSSNGVPSTFDPYTYFGNDTGNAQQGAEQSLAALAGPGLNFGISPFTSPAPTTVNLSSTESDQTQSLNTTFAIALPAARLVGDRLHILIVAGGTLTIPSGWTDLTGGTIPNSVFLVERIIDGTEGSSVTVSSTGTINWAAHLFLIRGSDPTVAGVATGVGFGNSSNTVDPPAVTAAWGVTNTLYIGYGVATQNGVTFTPPSGLTSTGQAISFAVVTVAWGSLVQRPETLDLGAWGLSANSRRSAVTVAIPPAPVGAFSVAPLQGPPGQDGQDGQDGRDGAPGAIGSTGPTGATGATGATGTPGANGYDGSDGVDGVDGYGFPGPPGFGATGATGATGGIGNPGNDGADGAEGYGFPGPMGPRGATGATGPTLGWDASLAISNNSGTSNPNVDAGQFLGFGAEGSLPGSGDVQAATSLAIVTNDDASIESVTGAIRLTTDGSAESSDEGDVIITTGGTERLRIDAFGEWDLAGDSGSAGQYIRSSGSGSVPTWATLPTIGAVVSWTSIASVSNTTGRLVGPTYTIPANAAVAGSVWMLVGWVTFTRSSGSTICSLTFDSKVGSTVRATTATVATQSAAGSYGHLVVGTINVLTSGSSGTATVSIAVLNGSRSAATNTADISATTASFTFNTTTTNAIDLGVSMNAANSALSVAWPNATIFQLK